MDKQGVVIFQVTNIEKTVYILFLLPINSLAFILGHNLNMNLKAYKCTLDTNFLLNIMRTCIEFFRIQHQRTGSI